jgi:outer membrane receptor for ferrienterochelin and colicins
MRRSLIPAVLLLAALRPAGAQGEPDSTARPTSLGAMVVTAARRPELESAAATPTTVITRDDIRLSAASDVAGVLAVRAGLQPAEGTPAGAGVLLQGLGGQRVLILLDGQPLVGRIGGGFDLSRIPVTSVERIEVVQGPQSLFYGSDALGGVVNIITRDPRALSRPSRGVAAEAEVVGGSHERLEMSTRLSKSRGNLSGTAAVGRRMQALTPGLPGDAGTRANRWDIASRGIWMHGEALTVDVGGLLVSEGQRYRTGQLYTFSDNEQYAANATAKWNYPTQTLSAGVAFSGFDHLSRRGTSGQPASDSGALDQQRLIKADVGLSRPLGPVLVDAGAEGRGEWITAERVSGGTRSVSGAAGFGQATWTASAVSLIPGARLTWSDIWGTTVSPRFAMLVRPRESLTMRAAVAGGFRAPDFKEQYLDFVNAPAGYAVRGNPDLRPEHSVNVNAGFDWRTSVVVLKANAYHNRFRDFIESVGPDGSGTFTYSNVARGRTAGIDVDASRKVGGVNASASYAYLNTRNDADAGPLLGRAPHTARVSVAMPIRYRMNIALAGVHTSRAPSARDQSGTITYRDALTQINVRAGRALGRDSSKGELFAAVDNVFDATAGADWPGFTGRRLSAGLSWNIR